MSNTYSDMIGDWYHDFVQINNREPTENETKEYEDFLEAQEAFAELAQEV